MTPAAPPRRDYQQPDWLPGKYWIRTTLATVFALMMLRLLGWGNPVVEVVLDVRSQAGADGEIFYAGPGEGYHPDRRVAFAINPGGKWQTYRVEIPWHGRLDRIRVDPGSAAGAVEIRRIGIDTSGRKIELANDRLSMAMETVNSMRTEAGASHPRFVASAPDPFVGFKLPVGAGVQSAANHYARWLAAAIAIAFSWLLLVELIWPRLARRLVPGLQTPRALHRLAAWASDPAALVVPPQAMALVVVTLCGAVLYIALNLHQSSIGVWEELFPARPVEQLVDLGIPRHVRSDEWNTETPWVLNQVAEGKPIRNLGIGGERAPLLASVPVAHVSALAQAKFYGFYLFDSDTGFSWWWAYKTFGLALALFWLLLVLTHGNVVPSVLGAVWIYGSSFTQWWLSTSLPELLIAFSLATTGGFYLLFARRKILVALGAALVGYSALNVLLHLYPPFIVPLAYLGAAILTGTALEPSRAALIRQGLGWRALCLFVVVVIVGLMGGTYLMDAMPSIEVMANTHYPGRRVSAGGDFPLVRLFYGFFEVFRIGEERLPLSPTNASEASSFIILVPLMLLAMPIAALMNRKNALLAALTLYCAVLALWISVPLPRGIEALMQGIGWSWSPPIRSVLGFGVGSIIAATVLFSRIRGGTVDLRPLFARRAMPLLVFASLLAFGSFLHGMDPAFFSRSPIVAASAIVSTMAAGVILGRTALFATGLALAVLPALLVNPLVSGLSAIQDKPVLKAAKRQGDGRNDRWVVVGAFVFLQGLKAQGLDVLTGSQMIPNRKLSRLLDPQGKYESTWNRYAHIVLRSEPGSVAPTYELSSADLYVIAMDICDPVLLELGVNRVAYTDAVPESDLKCLSPLEAPVDSGVRLFRLSPRTAVP